MEASENMLSWDEEWNISFAGCGFRSVYHLGASSCILERVPWLIHGASKIGGASSGCLVAAALTVGIPIEQFCVHVLSMAKEARQQTLGVFHPTFSLLRRVQESLMEKLPEDAHRRASGKLCVSLTRLADGKNVLVSEFESREELIQVLMCSCFFPVYCGFTPPSFRGVYYMDGALSNNMPLFENRNTITVAPFSGESDICPREGTFNFFDVHYGNVSIQVNTGNVHRICTSFLPPRLEKLAEICHNGYMDALRFLREKGLCEVCRESPGGVGPWSQLTEFLPVKLVLYLLTFLMLPIELSLLLTKSVLQSGCAVIYRLLTSATDFCTEGNNNSSPVSCSQYWSRYTGNKDMTVLPVNFDTGGAQL
ncbi:patatin-like phospholipase domain-containing protein 2 isoform X5 [Hippoglossus hippoglossus]|uniref:patatin-like phospholipase domain-containing protein 2 isoform X5 n=1 Tax=Hippoglossus hippoglossus TaxID=8267 RepID=UPI00148E5BED|nr:patatin-like phospholipase domain-containing protein 2 isoform X5 [Hippoglossus hippoglossus]